MFTRKILLRQIYQTQSMYKSNKNFSGISKKIFNVLKKRFYLFFSRPELNAQVGFSDSILYVVRHPVRLNFLHFSTSSPEPLGQYQPNLTQSIFLGEGNYVVS